jgi:tetratricopeptide (TPR) repeat protein
LPLAQTKNMPTSIELYDEADQLKDAGQLDQAIAKLNEVLAQEEDFTLAHSALAVLYGKVNRHEDAIRHGQRACELEPNDPFGFTALSVTFQRAFAGTGNQQYIQLAEDAMARSRAMQGH